MASESTAIGAAKYPAVKLPHPFLTSYQVRDVGNKLALTFESQPSNGRAPTQLLHNDSLTWLALTTQPASECPPSNDNGSWARARRAPETSFQWSGSSAPSLGQIWNVVHAIYLAQPTEEYFRAKLEGAGSDVLRTELLTTGLAIEHPQPWKFKNPSATAPKDELLILRSSFWQGAASPMGPRPIWVVGDGTDGPLRKPLDQYPLNPQNYQLTMKFPEEAVYTHHPVRRPKPHPGSICYSRYIPEVNEHFSLEVVDYQNQAHLETFNKWQNDPRVAAGWNETGTLDEHREYLRKLHIDPHVLCLFGRFDDSRFAYFELYWGKVSRITTQTFPSSFFRNNANKCLPGGPLRRTLGRRRLRPRPPLSRRRRLLPRRPPRQRLVLILHPLLFPRRAAHPQRHWRAQGRRRHHPVV